MIHPTYNNSKRPEAYLTAETKKCQCSVCGLVFSTENNFDRHRKGDYDAVRYCATPLEVGLSARCTKAGVVYGQYGTNPFN
jgi:hypothetical protein